IPRVDQLLRRLPLGHDTADMASHEPHHTSLSSFNAAVFAEPGRQECGVGQMRPYLLDRTGEMTPECQTIHTRYFAFALHCLSPVERTVCPHFLSAFFRDRTCVAIQQPRPTPLTWDEF